MEENKHTRLLVFLGIFLLAIVLVGGAYWASRINQTANAPVTPTPSPSPSTGNETATLPETDLPAGIPKDLPFPEGSAVVQNFTKGKEQSTRAVTTSVSPTKLYADFKAFGQANGWSVRTSLEQGNYKLLLLEKGKDLMQIDFSTITETKLTTVTVTISQLP